MALAAAVPLMVYAVHQGSLATDPAQVEGVAYATTGLGVVLAAQAVFAALRPSASRWLPRLVALTALWVGVAAVLWPEDLGSLGTVWGCTLISWAGLFATAAEFENRRNPRPVDPAQRLSQRPR